MWGVCPQRQTRTGRLRGSFWAVNWVSVRIRPTQPNLWSQKKHTKKHTLCSSPPILRMGVTFCRRTNRSPPLRPCYKKLTAPPMNKTPGAEKCKAHKYECIYMKQLITKTRHRFIPQKKKTHNCFFLVTFKQMMYQRGSLGCYSNMKEANWCRTALSWLMASWDVVRCQSRTHIFPWLQHKAAASGDTHMRPSQNFKT